MVGYPGPPTPTANPLDAALRDLAATLTLAPWRLDDRCVTSLRAVGFDEDTLFDAGMVATSARMFARITVLLAALGRAPA